MKNENHIMITQIPVSVAVERKHWRGWGVGDLG